MTKGFKSIKNKLIQRLVIVVLLCLTITVIISLIFLSPIMAGQALQKSEQATIQMLNHLDTVFNSITNYATTIINNREVENLALAYTKDTDNAQYYNQLKLKLHEFLTNLHYARGIVLEVADGRFVSSIAGVYQEDMDFLNGQWYREKSRVPLSQKFSDFYMVDSAKGVSSKISCAYCVNYQLKNQTFKLVIFFDTYTLLKTFERIAEHYLDDYTILNTSDALQIIVDEESGVVLPADVISEEEYISGHGDGDFFSEQSNYNMWGVLTYISRQSINKEYGLLLFYILITYGLLSTMTLILARFAISRLIAPIGELSDTINRISRGDWSAKAVIQTNDEIESLSVSFNNMLDTLNYYFDKTLDKEKKEQRMRYNLLISQIDPHFIYNTLSIITILARRSGNDEIVSINSALIIFLRDRLRANDANIFDTVEQEIAALNQYIHIANYRFRNNPVTVGWNIDEEVLACKIPKIVIQTLVENCFKHAFVDPDTGYELSITVAAEKEGMLITVADNGFGIEQGKLDELNDLKIIQTSARGKNIGIGNMKQILAHLYGKNSSVYFSSKRGAGTTVKIYLGSVINPGGYAEDAPED